MMSSWPSAGHGLISRDTVFTSVMCCYCQHGELKRNPPPEPKLARPHPSDGRRPQALNWLNLVHKNGKISPDGAQIQNCPLFSFLILLFVPVWCFCFSLGGGVTRLWSIFQVHMIDTTVKIKKVWTFDCFLHLHWLQTKERRTNWRFIASKSHCGPLWPYKHSSLTTSLDLQFYSDCKSYSSVFLYRVYNYQTLGCLLLLSKHISAFLAKRAALSFFLSSDEVL